MEPVTYEVDSTRGPIAWQFHQASDIETAVLLQEICHWPSTWEHYQASAPNNDSLTKIPVPTYAPERQGSCDHRGPSGDEGMQR